MRRSLVRTALLLPLALVAGCGADPVAPESGGENPPQPRAWQAAATPGNDAAAMRIAANDQPDWGAFGSAPMLSLSCAAPRIGNPGGFRLSLQSDRTTWPADGVLTPVTHVIEPGGATGSYEWAAALDGRSLQLDDGAAIEALLAGLQAGERITLRSTTTAGPRSVHFDTRAFADAFAVLESACL